MATARVLTVANTSCFLSKTTSFLAKQGPYSTSLCFTRRRAPSSLSSSCRRSFACTAIYNPEVQIKEEGQPETLDYRVFFVDRVGQKVSPWHDIPLQVGNGLFNCVVEIPKESSAKMEVATDEPHTPIKQDTKKGKLRYYPYNINWNYGLLPQTWEDPSLANSEVEGAFGDNDPVDVVEIGESRRKIGEVLKVKPLAALAMIDEGELDWKIVAISLDDPKASLVNDIDDVEKHFPGTLTAIRDWFRDYKIPDGKPANKFGLGNKAANKDFALKVITEKREKMGTVKDNHISVCHVVALPYPGRGHINPMMNLCKLLSSKKPDNTLLITFVVTEEWHGFIGYDPKPDNIRFATLPNAIPSELVRAKDFPGFVEAVSTKLEAPFEQLVDRLEPPVSAIVADPYVVWAVRVGNRRNIPVAALWPMSASVFSFFHHFELLKQNGQFPLDVAERGDEIVDYIPGLGTTSIADLPTIFYADGQKVLDRAIEAVSGVADKAQYLLSTSVYELEPQVFDTLKAKFAFPVYPIGPSIPHLELSESPPTDHNDLNNWLDSQPKHSVLYISLGSFLSVSKSQMDEIVAGVRNSGVRFLWVARGDASKLKDGVGDKGLVVPWCDQLRVLCHDSIGGFWSHCGWNSTLEAVYAGLPVLTCPIFWDQMPDSKQIVEDWKIGYRVLKKKVGAAEHEHLVTREEIAELVQRFMDLESKEGKEMRKRAKQLQETCHGAIAKGGSSDKNLDAFIEDISRGHHH